MRLCGTDPFTKNELTPLQERTEETEEVMRCEAQGGDGESEGCIGVKTCGGFKMSSHLRTRGPMIVNMWLCGTDPFSLTPHAQQEFRCANRWRSKPSLGCKVECFIGLQGGTVMSPECGVDPNGAYALIHP